MADTIFDGIGSNMGGLLAEVERMSFKQLDDCLRMLAGIGSEWPRKTNSLTTRLRKELFSATEARVAVLTVHLYFDHILSLILQRAGTPSIELERQSFVERLRRIEGQGILSTTLILQLRVLNSLRNKFAHNLFFDIAEWDPRLFSWILPVYKRVPVARKYRRLKHLLMFKVAMMKVYQDLHEEQRWLYLEDISGTRPRRKPA